MPMRFLIEPDSNGGTLAPGDQIRVEAERAHYLARVMRLKRGAVVSCFDGSGGAFNATLTNHSAKHCELKVTEIMPTAQPPLCTLTLGLSLLKGQAMDRALQQATELGATDITLVNARRSNINFSGKAEGRLDNKMRHWRKIITGACEQSGRLYIPRLHGPVSAQEAIEAAKQAQVIVFDPCGEPLPRELSPCDRLILIGPEGGWEEAELALFESSAVKIHRFGKNVLRAETSPAVALALVQHIQGWE